MFGGDFGLPPGLTGEDGRRTTGGAPPVRTGNNTQQQGVAVVSSFETNTLCSLYCDQTYLLCGVSSSKRCNKLQTQKKKTVSLRFKIVCIVLVLGAC